MSQLSLPLSPPMADPLKAAVLACLPAANFSALVGAVLERVPDADLCEIDATARALGAEQGEPGRYFYARAAA